MEKVRTGNTHVTGVCVCVCVCVRTSLIFRNLFSHVFFVYKGAKW